MKIDSSYSNSKKEHRIITLGYLWRWGSVGIVLLIPSIAFGICKLLNTESETQGFVTFFSWGITMVCVGTYDILGAVLEFKHILVSLQLAPRMPFKKINPRRDWTKSERKEYISGGVILVALGLAIIVIFTLMHFGILSST